MKSYNYKLNKTEHKIVPIGDIHLGSSGCDIELLQQKIRDIKNLNADVLLMGDMIENATKTSPGNGVYSQIMSPMQQVEEIIRLFKPIKKQIIMGVIGNHCVRASVSSGIDLMKVMMDGLDAGDKYAEYTGICRFKNNNTSYDLYAWHGSGGGSTLQGAIRPLRRQAEWINSDILLMGHVHHLYHESELSRRLNVNGVFEDVSKHFVLTGSFMKWDGQYPEMVGYKPMKLGCPLITLNGKKKEVRVDLEW